MFIWSMFLDQAKAVKLELLRAQYDCLYESPQVTWTKIPNKQSKFQINNQITGFSKHTLYLYAAYEGTVAADA